MFVQRSADMPPDSLSPSGTVNAPVESFLIMIKIHSLPSNSLTTRLFLMVSAFRVHGPGSSEQITITMESSRICGSGRFSNVYQAILTSPEVLPVAVKNVWEEKNNSSIVGTYPEIQVLSQLEHPNVVRLLYHFIKHIENQKIYCLVLNFMPEDMRKLRDRGVRLDLLDASLYSYQLFAAVAYLFQKKILHLDIKPANLLVDHLIGILQLGDFGNAQKLDETLEQKLTYQVTRYYRAPEVVFGTKFFSSAIDTWSAACCMAEFIIGRVLFKGKSSEQQMKLLIEVFGYPTDEDVKAMHVSRPRTSRPNSVGLKKFTGENFPSDALEILSLIFIYNPKKRITAEQCLTMNFFSRLKIQPIPRRLNGSLLPSLVEVKRLEKKRNDTEENLIIHK